MFQFLKLLLGFFAIIIVAGVVLGFLNSKPSNGNVLQTANTWQQDKEPWLECKFNLPKGYGKVTLLIQKAHPFLAEYNEKLSIKHPDQATTVFKLNVDTGGEEFLNFYLSEADKASLRLNSKWNEAVIDLNSLKQKPLDTNTAANRWLYIGRCDKKLQSVRFVSPTEAKEEPIPEPTGS